MEKKRKKKKEKKKGKTVQNFARNYFEEWTLR